MVRDWQQRCRDAGGTPTVFPRSFGDKAGAPACRFQSAQQARPGFATTGRVTISYEDPDFSFADQLARIGDAVERADENSLGQRVNEFFVRFTDSVKLTGGPNGDILPDGVVGVAANVTTKVIDFGARVVGLPPIVLLALALLAGFVFIRSVVLPQARGLVGA